jgi:hypothetical protein
LVDSKSLALSHFRRVKARPRRACDAAWGAVMAIKKVPSDASIRIGSIWFPVRNLPAALARHAKLVFCLTGSDDHPYSLRGSATGLKFQDRHLLFCCGHQIANIEPRNVVIPLDKEGRTLISGQQMVSLV